jgi:glutamate/tyrosine decarboxylase-like PLP-dependent enzyme
MTDKKRKAEINLDPEQFRQLGHDLIDQLADFLKSLPNRPVTPGESPSTVRSVLGQGDVPIEGTDVASLLKNTTTDLIDHSLFNSHPMFMGYITASPTPIGMLGDLIASAINQNVGAWGLSPLATEIEFQTVKWIAQMIGYPDDCGGVFVSGGNMANFTCFLVGRRAMLDNEVREKGIDPADKVRIYANEETHIWLEKAVDMFGLGRDSIRWIPSDDNYSLKIDVLNEYIEEDIKAGCKPIMVIATGGSVSSGAIDPIGKLAETCQKYKLWLHVDGAYGAMAALLPDTPEPLKYLAKADSVALDPHKWLYAPLEAGCALIKDAELQRDTFSFHAPYYKFDTVNDEPAYSFVDYSPQNSRGFRGLKVWLGLMQVGRKGYEKMIAEDIRLSKYLYDQCNRHNELEACTQSLSITTFRFIPKDLELSVEKRNKYLDELNTELLTRLQEGGEAYVSNAVLDGRYLFRACVVNFRTSEADMDKLIEIVVRLGREVDSEMRQKL